MILLVTTALAAPDGYYHPEDIAPRSEVFMGASVELSALFDDRSGSIEQLAVALQQYRETLDLMGSDAPAAERDRLAALEKEYHRQQATVQAFADALVEDFDGAMRGAMDRALEMKGEVVRCLAALPTGPRVPGMPVKTQKNPECQGEDYNPDVAAAMDRDEALTVAITELLARPWPEVTIPSEAQAAVGGGERWMSFRDLMVASRREALIRINAEDDQARMAIEAALEQGQADMAALKTQVDGIEQATADKRAALAAPLIAVAVERMAKKWKGEPAVAWCANPRLLGGCEGTDASTELVGRLLDDKKFAKALTK